MAKRLKSFINRYWHRSRWHKLMIICATAILVTFVTIYGVAQWYVHSSRHKPLVQGVSFIPAYAESLGLDSQETMDGLLGIGVRHFRLVSYWNQMEPAPGQYDFSLLDWQFKKAEAAGAQVSLTVGLRQPRWPECHAPAWVNISAPHRQWQPQLEAFMQKVIERYKDSPSLASYQLENEFFLQGFGICTDRSRDRLISEYNLIKRTDPSRPVIVSRSNNAIGIPINEPKPDAYAVSIYKRVWDANVTKRYLEYPYPAWYYGFLAGLQKLNDGRDMIIHELQAEAWAPNGKSVKDISLDEQNKSLNADRLADRFEYGRATGMRQIYLWGAEYWYYRLKVLDDPSLWQVAQQEF